VCEETKQIKITLSLGPPVPDIYLSMRGIEEYSSLLQTFFPLLYVKGASATKALFLLGPFVFVSGICE